MKKILSIALVAILAAGSAFATFSGDASVALGYNWETGEYGFSNGTGLNFDIDLATADEEKIAEGSVYAGIKAHFGLKVANAKDYAETGNGFGALLPPVKDGYEDGALGVFAEVEEAYVAGENWKVSILGTKGAPDYAKSAIETKKDAVRDVFGNKYDEKDVPVTFKAAANDLDGITATVYDWTASFGFVGNSGKGQLADATEIDTFDYNVFFETPAFDFDVVSFQAAAIASSGSTQDITIDEEEAKLIIGNSIGASAKVGFDADIVTGSVAVDYGTKNFKGITNGEDTLYFKDIEDIENSPFAKIEETWLHGLDIAANLAITPVTLDVYFSNEDLTNEKKLADDEKLAANLLSAQVKADLAAFEIPVALTVYGKDMLDKTAGQDFGAKAEMTFDAFSVTAKGGYKLGEDKLYIGGEVGYTHDLFAVKAGADWSILTDTDDSNVLSVKASVESSAIIPGATLSLAYGAADEDMNLLEQAGSGVAQNFGKVEAKCKIEF